MSLCNDCNLPVKDDGQHDEGRTCRENWDYLAANPPKRTRETNEEGMSDDPRHEQDQVHRDITL